MGVKSCTKCEKTKPLDLFPRAKRGRYGRHSWCRSCCAEARRDRRASGRESELRRERRKRNPELAIYRDVVRRCTDETRRDYHHYGGREITVAPEWMGPGGFEKFLAHIGKRPTPKHSIDRIDNDGNYEPGNVRWATRRQQMSNFSRNRLITVDGETQTLAQWSRRLGVEPRLIQQRIDYLGWSESDAVSTPPNGRRG